MPKPVITGALLRVAQDGVRFGSLFEAFFGITVTGITVGMELEREFPVRRFQRLLVAIA